MTLTATHLIRVVLFVKAPCYDEKPGPEEPEMAANIEVILEGPPISDGKSRALF